MAPKTMKRQQKKKQTKKRASPTAIGAALRALGGIGGGALGGYLGNASLGGAAGTSLGAMVSRWLGQGDYTLNSNSLVARFKSSGDIPNMHSNNQSIVVRHKEYVTDVLSSTAFASFAQYPLNPGLSTSFPWLSGIAQQFQEYTWKGIIYEFISTSGDVVASSNTALGSVMMVTSYRATAPPFTNKVQLLNEFFASDAKPSESFCHPIECNPKENPYNVQYVRGAAVPAGEDQKTYDLGVMTVATMGMQAASVDIGELWVSYEVELRKPVSNQDVDNFALAAHYTNTTTSAAAQFGTARVALYDNIGMSFSSTTCSFPLGSIGTYQVTIVYNACTVASFPTFFSGGTGALVNCTWSLSLNGTISQTTNSSYTANGTGNAIVLGFCTITNPELVASFTPNSGITITGTSVTEVLVAQVALNSN